MTKEKISFVTLRWHLQRSDLNYGIVILVFPPEQDNEEQEHEEKRIHDHERNHSRRKGVAAPKHT